jgi:hypothetical protein
VASWYDAILKGFSGSFFGLRINLQLPDTFHERNHPSVKFAATAHALQHGAAGGVGGGGGVDKV